jgi:hypothetical protein
VFKRLGVVVLLFVMSSVLTPGRAQDQSIDLGSLQLTIEHITRFDIDDYNYTSPYPNTKLWLFEGKLLNQTSSQQCLDKLDIRFWGTEPDDLYVVSLNDSAMAKVRDKIGIDYPSLCVEAHKTKPVYMIVEMNDEMTSFQVRYKGHPLAVIQITNAEKQIAKSRASYIKNRLNTEVLSFVLQPVNPSDILLTLDFGDLTLTVTDSFYFDDESSSGAYLIWFGTLKNNLSQSACLFGQDISLRIEDRIYPANPDLMGPYKDLFGIDYPGRWSGQCVNGFTDGIYTFLLVFIPDLLQNTEVIYKNNTIASLSLNHENERLNITNLIDFDVTDVAMQTQVRDITLLPPYDLPNCGGTGEMSDAQTYEESTEKSSTVRTTMSASGAVDANIVNLIPLGAMQTRVYGEAGYSYSKEDFSRTTISQSQTVTLTAAPHTKVTYHMKWVMVSYVGSGLLKIEQRDPVEIEFLFDDHMMLVVVNSEETPCQ